MKRKKGRGDGGDRGNEYTKATNVQIDTNLRIVLMLRVTNFTKILKQRMYELVLIYE